MKRARILEAFSICGAFVLCAFVILPRLSGTLDAIATEQVASTASMGASVAPNPSNTLAMQLRDWQTSLEARDAAVASREEKLRAEQATEMKRQREILIGTILFFLVVLIVTNTYTHHRDLAQISEIRGSNTFHGHVPRMAFAAALDLRVKRDALHEQKHSRI